MAGSTFSGKRGAELPPAKPRVVVPRSGDSARLGLTPRRSVAAARTAAAQSLQRFLRQEYWNGLAAGDVVRVSGHTARGRHWRFRAHVTNTSNGATWVEVALVDGPPPSKRPISGSNGAATDGSPGDGPAPAPRVEKVRSFDPSLVTPRWRGRGRVATLLRPAGGAAGGGKSAPDGQPEELSEQSSLF